MTHKNETFLERLRESKAKGPFTLQEKGSGFLHYSGIGFLTPVLKRWEETLMSPEVMDSPQKVANYLEETYLGKDNCIGSSERGGYGWILKGKRHGLTGGLVLKLEDVPHPDSKDAREGHPAYHIWLKIKPNPLEGNIR